MQVILKNSTVNTNFLNSTNFLIQNPNYKISAAQLIVNIHKRHNFTVSEIILNQPSADEGYLSQTMIG